MQTYGVYKTSWNKTSLPVARHQMRVTIEDTRLKSGNSVIICSWPGTDSQVS